jgi:uncharacterized protein YkwD
LFAVAGVLCFQPPPAGSLTSRPANPWACRANPWGVPLTASEAELFNALQRYRLDRGRGPLRLEPHLISAARGRTNARYQTGHRVNGQMPWAAARQHGYRGNSIGENLAWGNNPTRTVSPQWQNSPGHNRNQLGDWRDCGVAVGNGRNGSARVAMFGR